MKAIDAIHKYLNVDGDPLIDLRCLNHDMGEEMEARYSDAYDQAPDGDPTPDEVLFNQAFAIMMGEPVAPKTKGDVLRDWTAELITAFPRAFMEDYTRDEATTILTLLNRKHVDGSLFLQLSPGFRYNLFDLMRGWNESHPDEQPITFTGYGDYMP